MSSLWNCEKDFSCLSPPVCGVCLSSPSKPVQSISGPWCIFWNLPFFHGGYTGHLPRLGGMASQGLLSSLDSGWVIQATLAFTALSSHPRRTSYAEAPAQGGVMWRDHLEVERDVRGLPAIHPQLFGPSQPRHQLCEWIRLQDGL
ncbi:potassium voltage-gated channel subfamily E member 4 isoform X3 [Lagenorhynchus albirostris]|uniref:potassium voltage-gated channel subfamily E member 4 isoform X3 n=1 Tax=Lagenorhynchus albirostris TaxID=27610 RepID=UPI0028F0087E|nr:potassium voltage-gated channel subfamily E member 4 isoform X3 [Lagenorhynchus albirostris]